MKFFPRWLLALFLIGVSTTLLALQGNAFQRSPFDSGPGYISSNGIEKAGFIFARLRYSSARSYEDYGYGFRFGGGWSEDFPKGDRQFVEGTNRLTRVKARPTEEVIEPDTDEMYDYPFLYAVNVGTWVFSKEQADRLHEYLERGGFMVVDSFHGEADWQHFLVGMHQILPTFTVEELDSKDEIFHVLYDLDERFQVPGYQYISTGRTYEKDGFVPHWRAIRDDKGRIMVLLNYNMHLGDAWEHADDPRYPERFSSLAYRLGINYVIYGMTH